MIEWLVTIGITITCVLIFSPKKNSHVWLGALVPLGCAIIYVIGVSLLTSGYKAGLVTSKLIYPVVVSGCVIFFLLRKKMKNSRIETWVFITSLIILLLFATPTIITFFLKKDIDKSLKIINTAYKNNNVKYEIIPEVKKQDIEIINTFNKHGLTFRYNNKWEVSDYIEADGQLFKVVCENKTDALEFLIIMWIKVVASPEEFIAGIIEELKATEDYKHTMFINIPSLDDKSYSATYSNFRPTNINGEVKVLRDFYGDIESYNKGNMTVLTIKQSSTKENLKTSFRTIEDNMKFED
ncbi:MAG: hypothetical protein BWX96_00632 [Bacteroidetes bacterium ADurb.Bin145]|jgi:hypothetical protein|nr:MAG: hypothetical protein BWX96_00632 [Bacteroidetes bacterium ADurb.Bin145]